MLSTLAVLAAEDESGGSPLSLLILPLMFVGAYFLLIRPQRRRMKEQVNLQAALAEGDEVITTSGIYGFITGFDGDVVWLEIDDNIQIRVARAAVQRKVDTSSSMNAEIEKHSTPIDRVADDSPEN